MLKRYTEWADFIGRGFISEFITKEKAMKKIIIAVIAATMLFSCSTAKQGVKQEPAYTSKKLFCATEFRYAEGQP